MSRLFVLLVALFGLASSAMAQSGNDPFRVEISAARFPVSSSGVLEVRVVVPKGHHIYKDMFQVDILDGDGLELGKPDLPPGLKRPDPATPGQTRELYAFDVIVEIPVKTPEVDGVHDPLIEVQYQGCREGLCYPPRQHKVSPMVLVGDATGMRSLPAGTTWVDTHGGGSGSSGHPPNHGLEFSDLPELAVVASTGDDGKPHPVVARLVSDHVAVVPGGALRLGIHLDHADGWHTYWRSKPPGSTIGQATNIEWTLPAGTQKTPYKYAVPTRFEVSGVVSYGYDVENFLFTELTLPSSLGDEVTLGAEVNWLVCKETCIPGSASLSLTLPVVQDAPNPGPYFQLFESYAELHPTPIAEVEGLLVTVGVPAVIRPDSDFLASFLIKSTNNEAIEFPVEAETWPAFAPISPEKVMVFDSKIHPVEGAHLLTVEGWVLEDYVDDGSAEIGALLQLKVGDRTIVTEVVSGTSVAAEGEHFTETTSADFSNLDFSEEIPWIPFNEQNLRGALCADAPIFVDFTAEWCLSCKVNEGTVLETDTVRSVMAANGVIPLKADWTNRDPLISRWLKHFERGGVPFYLVIPAGGGLSAAELKNIGPEKSEVVLGEQAIVLGEFITPDSVVSAIEDGTGAEKLEATFGSMLFFAFLGGLILNIFPCVLPVLALKLYSLVEQQDSTDRHRRGAGIAYTLGVVLSFLALAIAVILMKQVMGVEVAWGFMFQEPTYVVALAVLVFVFGLSLIGVFDVPALGANQAAEASGRGGLQGHFLTGVFATLIATPCSAPFLGPAMGFALSLDQLSIVLFFAVAGLGLALPFLVVAFVPKLIQFLPKPGAWMETFKVLVGWSMMAVVAWLVIWVFGSMTEYRGIVAVACFLGSIGVGCAIFGKYGSIIETGRRQLAMLGVGVIVGAVGGWLSMVESGWVKTAEPTEEESITAPLVCATE